MPLPDKIEAIKKITVPTTKKKLQNFLGLVNYYKDIWKHRSVFLTPISLMTSEQAKWNCSKECQKAFDIIKKVTF